MKITILRITGVSYRRSRSHANRLAAAGTHVWKNGTLLELDPQQIRLRDRVFRQSPSTSAPPKWLPFNYPLPLKLLRDYRRNRYQGIAC